MMASQPQYGLFNTEERVLRSECVGQDYRIGVWFPFSYGMSDRRYPVLYVPDAEFAFGLATSLMPILIGGGEIPELLVVGISYHGIADWREHGILRDRDFCPPGFQNPPSESRLPSYTTFYQQELFPFIESEYRGNPDDRALFGFSSGGFFAMHCMLTQPGMFHRFIAASCTWQRADQLVLEWERCYADQPNHPSVDVYLSVGGLEDEQLPGFRAVTDALRTRNDPTLRLTTEVLEGERHSAGVLAKTFLNGVRTVFKS